MGSRRLSRELARAAFIATGVAAAFAAQASAQPCEIVPFVGYRFGGALALANETSALEVKDSAAWGASFTVQVSRNGELEALFARQATRLDSGGFFTSQPRFGLGIEVYHLGGNYLFGDEKSRLRPYIGMGLGV